MAISDSNSASVSSDAKSQWVALRAGKNLIGVTSDTWGGSTTATLEFSSEDSDDKSGVLQDAGVDVVFDQNRYREVHGPGYARIDVASYAGSTEITIQRLHPN